MEIICTHTGPITVNTYILHDGKNAAIIDPGRLLEDATVARISALVGRVADGEPLQYVLGEAVFMGMRLRGRLKNRR